MSPDLNNIADCTCSELEGFRSGGVNVESTSTLLMGIMKPHNLNQDNAAQAEIAVYGCAYIQLSDGSFLLGEPVNRSFREQVELIDLSWSGLESVQKDEILSMYHLYKNIMDLWNIPLIISSGTNASENGSLLN